MDEAAVIKRAVAASYRQVAAWTGGIDDETGEPTNDKATLYRIAEAVDTFEPGDDCPCCQETTCDEDCPLAPIRNAAPTRAR